MEKSQSTGPVVLKGSCACGRITYTSTSSPAGATNCHCTECRKIAGAPYISFAAFPRQALTWSQAPDIWKSSDIAERGFCFVCGSCLTMQYYLQPDRISIAMGSIDESTEDLHPPSEHIFVGSKAVWFTIPHDGLPRFDLFDFEFQEKLEAWRREKKR